MSKPSKENENVKSKKSILDSHAAVYTLIGFGFAVGLVLGQMGNAPDQSLLNENEQYKIQINKLETEISRLNNVIIEKEQVVEIDSKTVKRDDAFTICNGQVFIEVVGIYPVLEQLDLEIKVQNAEPTLVDIYGKTTKEAFSYKGERYVIAVTEYTDSMSYDSGSAVLSIYKKK